MVRVEPTVGPQLSKEYEEKVLEAMKTLEKEERKTRMSDKDIDRALRAMRIVSEEFKRTWNLKPGEQIEPWIKGQEAVIVTEHGAEMSAKLPDAYERKAKKLVDAAFEACREDIRYNPVETTGGLYCIHLKLIDPRFRKSIFRPGCPKKPF